MNGCLNAGEFHLRGFPLSEREGNGGGFRVVLLISLLFPSLSSPAFASQGFRWLSVKSYDIYHCYYIMENYTISKLVPTNFFPLSKKNFAVYYIYFRMTQILFYNN